MSKDSKSDKKASSEKPTLRHMKISEIKVDSAFARSTDDVTALKESIELNGIIHPIVIDKNNLLICGSRRLEAARQLGLKEVPVIVSAKDSLSNEMMSIEENLQRKNFKGYQLDVAIARYQEIYRTKFPETVSRTVTGGPGRGKKTKDELSPDSGVETFTKAFARRIGVSPKTVERSVRRIKDSAEPVVEAWQQGDLKPSQVDLMVRLEKNVQGKILPHIIGKDLVFAETIVQEAKRNLEAAIAMAEAVTANEAALQVKKIIDLLDQLDDLANKVASGNQKFEIESDDQKKLKNAIEKAIRSLTAILPLSDQTVAEATQRPNVSKKLEDTLV